MSDLPIGGSNGAQSLFESRMAARAARSQGVAQEAENVVASAPAAPVDQVMVGPEGKSSNIPVDDSWVLDKFHQDLPHLSKFIQYSQPVAGENKVDDHTGDVRYDWFDTKPGNSEFADMPSPEKLIKMKEFFKDLEKVPLSSGGLEELPPSKIGEMDELPPESMPKIVETDEDIAQREKFNRLYEEAQKLASPDTFDAYDYLNANLDVMDAAKKDCVARGEDPMLIGNLKEFSYEHFKTNHANEPDRPLRPAGELVPAGLHGPQLSDFRSAADLKDFVQGTVSNIARVHGDIAWNNGKGSNPSEEDKRLTDNLDSIFATLDAMDLSKLSPEQDTIMMDKLSTMYKELTEGVALTSLKGSETALVTAREAAMFMTVETLKRR